MKKEIKKLFAVFAAFIMTFALCTGVKADGAKPTNADKKLVTVTNVEEGATVTAYQITKAEYNENGFVKYVKANDSLTIADVMAPTSDEVSVIAEATTGLTSKTLNYADGKYTEELEPGYWVIVVSGTVSKVYNPMLAGVYYSVSGSDNTMVGGEIDANTNWTLETTNAYAKSSEVTTEKTIVGSGSGNDHGDDVAFDDVVKFQITSKIPSYSKEYTHATFIIHDEMSDGLDYVVDAEHPVTVTVGGETYTGAVVNVEGRKMSVQIPSEFILERDADGLLVNAGKTVAVTYSAQLNENAGVNFDANTNTAKTEYTNDPSETSDADKKTTDTPEDKTYHYTFGIDASLGGSVTNTETTKELFKIDGKTGEVTVSNKEVTVKSPLAGAEFKLTNNATNKEYTATSADDGSLNFEGLDAGTYTLVETKAPEGYTIDTTTHTVEISATYVAAGENKGRLESYTITIDGNSTSTYTASYTKQGTNTEITVDKTAIGSVGIKNITLSALPSTGGMGTYLFTAVGVAIMAVASVLYMRNRAVVSK